MRQPRTRKGCFALLTLVLTGPRAWSQPPAPVPAGEGHKIGAVTLQGSLRSRAEVWDWFPAAPADNRYAYSGNLLRLSFTKTAQQSDWQVEFAVPFLLGLPPNAVAPGPPGQFGMGAAYFAANQESRNTAMFFPKQAFFRWKNVGGVAGQSVRAGRFEFGDGTERTPQDATLAALKRDRINGRLVGTFAFTHVGRSYDGIHYAWNKPSHNFTLLAAIPTRGVFQTDGWGQVRTALGYTSYTRDWSRGRHAAETRGMAVYYQDWRHIVKSDSRPLTSRREDFANIRIGTFGGHHVSAVATKAGTLDLLLWGVAQTGRWGRIDHRAHAFAVEGGLQPAPAVNWLRRWKPWLRAGFSDGSGDPDPNDTLHETFFQLLPTPRSIARMTFYNLMNNRDLHLALVSRPHPKLTVSNEFHSLRLSHRNDLWYLGGGVFQPWSFGYPGRVSLGAQSLATLYDASADYRLSPALSFNLYLGYAQALAAARAAYPGARHAVLGFLEMTWRF